MEATSLPDLLSLYRSDARVARVADGLRAQAARVQIAGTIGSAQALIANAVIEQRGGVHVFVLTDKEEAAYFINDLEALRGKDKEARHAKKEEDLLFYPAPSRSPYDPEGHQDGERVSRTEVLEALMKKPERLVLITHPEALVPLVMGKEEMAKNTLTVKRNEELREAARRRNHRRALRALIERLEEEDGPLDSPEDLAAIARYRAMLS